MADPDHNGHPAMDVRDALRNVVLLLQADPTGYRRFGIWWWPIKAVLRGAGYNQDHLFMLGQFNDAEQAAMVPRESLADTLRAAFTEYAKNTCYPHADGSVETPDGELVQITDPDAGGR